MPLGQAICQASPMTDSGVMAARLGGRVAAT
jgi:hypothetical protein